MAIQYHPKPGTILVCDFTTGFKVPEMVKKRPVIVLSPQISQRAGLCTIVAISTDPPRIKLPYHCELLVDLPPPWDEGPNWVKGDMIYSVGFHRLDLIRIGRDQEHKRIYNLFVLDSGNLREVRRCVLCGLGLAGLTRNLA